MTKSDLSIGDAALLRAGWQDRHNSLHYENANHGGHQFAWSRMKGAFYHSYDSKTVKMLSGAEIAAYLEATFKG